MSARPVPGAAPDDAEAFSAEIERRRQARAQRALAVPCGLRDADRCDETHDCPLRADPDCPVRLRTRAADAARRKQEAQTRRIREAALAAGIPSRHWHLLSIPGAEPGPKFRETEALAAIHADRALLVLCGLPGVGKSGAAAVWCWERGGIWRPASEVARMSWYEKGAVAELIAAPALVLDEVGVEVDDGKGVWRSRLDELVSGRYDARRPTCITTNLTPEAAKVLLGERIGSRIEEVGDLVVCGGESLRRRREVQEGLPGVER
jgi:hypothetical protein